jgi:uncharacterized phage-associated protein
MPYSPAVIANYFLNKASREGRALTPMQLIKLVYIAHGWYLGYFNKPLINEPVEAWKFGPVIRTLYHQVKKYGAGAVTDLLPTASMFGATDKIDADASDLLDRVWEAYARFSGVQLSKMTHQPGTPWDKAWKDGGVDAPLQDSEIAAHYREKMSATPA